MDRREMLGAVGLGTAGLLAMGGHARGAQSGHLDPEKTRCIQSCNECATACEEASHHCLMELEEGKGDRRVHAQAHHMAMDCAALCRMAAAFMARQSPLHGDVCQACAEACRRCAEACAKGQNVTVMEECARICRECEKSCRDMARTAHAH